MRESNGFFEDINSILDGCLSKLIILLALTAITYFTLNQQYIQVMWIKIVFLILLWIFGIMILFPSSLFAKRVYAFLTWFGIITDIIAEFTEKTFIISVKLLFITGILAAIIYIVYIIFF